MKAVSGKRLARALGAHGWALLRIQGSYHIYGRSGSIARLSIPTCGNRPLKVGLLKHLLKVAGLREEDV